MSISDDSLTGVNDRASPGDPDGRTGTPAVHRFERPVGIRRLQALTVLVAAAVCVAVGLWVWLDRDATGLLGVTLTLTAAMWIAWFGVPTSTARVEYGALVVAVGDAEHRIDLAGADLRVVSVPGQRGWRVVFRRPGRRPLVVDASMVDPVEFTRVLARWRPDLPPSADRPAVPGDAPAAP